MRQSLATRFAPHPHVTLSRVPQLNDIHSQLNATTVKAIHRPSTIEELQRMLAASAQAGEWFAVSGW